MTFVLKHFLDLGQNSIEKIFTQLFTMLSVDLMAETVFSQNNFHSQRCTFPTEFMLWPGVHLFVEKNDRVIDGFK